MVASEKWFYIGVSLITIALIYFLAPILTPFVVGALIAYLSDPIVDLLVRARLPRLLGVVIVFLLIFISFTLLVVFLVPLIENQILILIDLIPDMTAWVQNTILPWLTKHFGISETLNFDSLKANLVANWAKAGGVVSWTGAAILHSGFALLQVITNLILIPVVTFYLLRDWDDIVLSVRGLLPRPIEPTVVHLVTECDAVLGAFFRGQLLVMLALAVVYSIGLTIVGLKIALLVGLAAGLLSIVPYLGFIVGIISASIAASIQFGGIVHVIPVLIVFAVGQGLEGMVLTPKLIGHRIGLHPVAVIFSVLVGAYLFGFFGVLLALPVAAMIMVLLRFLYRRYLSSEIYGDV